MDGFFQSAGCIHHESNIKLSGCYTAKVSFLYNYSAFKIDIKVKKKILS